MAFVRDLTHWTQRWAGNSQETAAGNFMMVLVVVVVEEEEVVAAAKGAGAPGEDCSGSSITIQEEPTACQAARYDRRPL